IDNIPDNWSVVSIGLGADKADLIMSRLQANKTPLILRLPLSRHNSRDMDEETFEFEAARQELADIVKTSNDSAQAAKNIIGKQAKLEWWELRKSLDERLRTLLFNMERCWLGGFRGLLGRSKHDSAAFDQFKSSFAKIMMTYVPFRSNRSFDIDTRILDLFVDLGSIDQDELLELLEDLLYFILDIYQFHGESIAYDEIDIDRMTVDIQTALNAFHERAAPAVSDAHTILILDKELSEFPWESTNCLRGLSVSRVPSLAALKGMLDAHGAQPQSSAVGGRYILNPSQDLKQTEVFFHERLQSLPDWQGITSRVPEEAEVLDYLGQGSIYIYFGHGGGEQYVRASKLKQLPKTALAILMGCSSGALRDQGLYDRWGTPYNYLVAGSPCVLANLWDVTDKDIDRFSEKVLTLWGLFASTDSQQSPVKGKRRQALQKPQDFQGMSLPLAVSQSRDECVMPYLNGAAPVVYGLPVHL
ncbi:peptidase family C50-domain-containing protein, partial [Protomyces lactucae-debilis]